MEGTHSTSFPGSEKLNLLLAAAQELLLHDVAAKKEFRLEAAPELQKGEGSFTFSECISALFQTGAGKDVLSSLETQGPLLLSMAFEYRSLCDLLDPHFEFSEITAQFEVEFTVLLVLFFNAIKPIPRPSSGTIINSEFPKKDDPKFDLAIMKALFQAGKIIERLKSDGWQTSDWAKQTGSAKHKGYVSDQDVFRVAKDVAKRLKTKRSIARVVRKRLLEDESRKENPKKVYEEDHIRKEILKEAWPEIL